MSKSKGISTLQLESSPDATAEVVVHSKPHNLSQDILQFTADFAALSVKGTANTSSINASPKATDAKQNVHEANNSLEYPNVFTSTDSAVQHQSFLIGQSVINHILLILPAMIDQHLGQNSSQESPFLSSEVIHNDIGNIAAKQTELHNKLNAYQKELHVWSDKVKNVEISVNDLQRKFDQQQVKNNATENSLVLELNKIKQLKTSLDKQLKQIKIDQNTVKEIDASQDFVSTKYDDFLKKHKEMKDEVKEIRQKLTKQENKTEHISNYSRWDHAEFDGVPHCFGPDGTENCKEMIVNICRELSYNIPINEISTAHRVKQHPAKSGPPKIIVRFKDRDIRNDVLKLRSQLKDKLYWRNYGITRLFINEQLTPEKKKLMYLTKIFTREMFRIHGKIFAWSHKGEIYVRKALDNAPKQKINCEKDLDDMRRGIVSLDPVTNARATAGRTYTSKSISSANACVTSQPIPAFSLNSFPILGRV